MNASSSASAVDRATQTRSEEGLMAMQLDQQARRASPGDGRRSGPKPQPQARAKHGRRRRGRPMVHRYWWTRPRRCGRGHQLSLTGALVSRSRPRRDRSSGDPGVRHVHRARRTHLRGTAALHVGLLARRASSGWRSPDTDRPSRAGRPGSPSGSDSRRARATDGDDVYRTCFLQHGPMVQNIGRVDARCLRFTPARRDGGRVEDDGAHTGWPQAPQSFWYRRHDEFDDLPPSSRNRRRRIAARMRSTQ